MDTSSLLFVAFRKDLSRLRWLQMVAMLSVPLGYLAGQAGWVLTECRHQPWTIQKLLLVAGHNNTAYYPSTVDLQSSLTLRNSSSSEFTL